MFIIVDQNEQATNPTVVERMRKTFPNLQIANLTCGDVNIILDTGDVLAIERKRADDLLGSIGDGRVFRQVEQMAQGAKWSCIIVEGHITFDKKTDMTVVNGRETKWRGVSVRGALMAIQFAGCPVIPSMPETYPDVISDVIAFCSKPEVHQQSLSRKRIVTFPPIDLKEEIIAAFPGVGLKRARSLFEFVGSGNENQFSSLAEAICWITAFPGINQSARPEGWGNGTVMNFRAALGLKENEYLTLVEEKEKSDGSKKSSKKK